MQEYFRQLDHNLKRQILDYLTKYTVTNQLSKLLSRLDRGCYPIENSSLIRIMHDAWVALYFKNGRKIYFRIKPKGIKPSDNSMNGKKLLIDVFNLIKNNNLRSIDRSVKGWPVEIEKETHPFLYGIS